MSLKAMPGLGKSGTSMMSSARTSADVAALPPGLIGLLLPLAARGVAGLWPARRTLVDRPGHRDRWGLTRAAERHPDVAAARGRRGRGGVLPRSAVPGSTVPGS